MKDMDLILLWILTALGFAAAVLRTLLAKKQGQPNRLLWSIQEFLFPVLLLVGLVLYQTGIQDIVFQLVMLGLVEEIICIFLRRRTRSRDSAASSNPSGTSDH